MHHTLRILKVMSPQWPDLILTSNVPHSEADILVLDGLYVEACMKLSSTNLLTSKYKYT